MPTFKRFDGTNNVDPTFVRRWDGSAYVDVSFVRRFDGTNWVNVWPLVDLTPNAVSPGNALVYTNATGGMSSTPNYRDTANVTISGITGEITLRLLGSKTGDAGVEIMYSKNNGSWIYAFRSDVLATSPSTNNLTVAMNNGDTIKFRVTVFGELADMWTTYTNREASGNMQLVNTSDGDTVIGTLTYSGGFSDTYDDGSGGGGIRP